MSDPRVLQIAVDAQTRALVRSCVENGGCPGEADEDLNENQRDLIAAVARAHGGEAWLGEVNKYGANRHGATPYLWRWDGGLVRNFACAFVLPRFDPVLAVLIAARDDQPWDARKDYVLITEIFDRLAVVGGHPLLWT